MQRNEVLVSVHTVPDKFLRLSVSLSTKIHYFLSISMAADNSGFIVFRPEITSNLLTDSILHISKYHTQKFILFIYFRNTCMIVDNSGFITGL